MKILYMILCGVACVLHADEIPKESLNLKISFNIDEFKDDDTIYLKYLIKNNDKKPIYVLCHVDNTWFGVKDLLSGKQIVSENTLPIDSNVTLVDKDNFKLLKPGDAYTLTNYSPICIKQETNGVYWLEYEFDRYSIPVTGFIISAHFFGSSYDMKQIEGLDTTVPLFGEVQIVSETSFIYDGEYFRKGVRKGSESQPKSIGNF